MQRSTLGSEPVFMSHGHPYQNTQWIAAAPPTSVNSQKKKPLSPVSSSELVFKVTTERICIKYYNSADSSSPFAADIRSHKFEIFSTPSYGTSALNSQSTKMEPPPFVYKSIMVTFDTSSENVVVGRRQMRVGFLSFAHGWADLFFFLLFFF